MRGRVVAGIALACAATVGAGNATAGGEIGVSGGLTRANVDPGGDDKLFEPRYSGTVGALVELRLPARLAVRVEAQWLTRGFDYGSRGGESHTARYLELPVSITWRPLTGEHLAAVYMLLGLSGGVRLNESIETGGCVGCSGITELPRLNASLVAGGGLRVGHRLAFLAEARYVRGLRTFGWDDGRWDGGDATTREVQVLVGLSRRW
jgi:hypothetical protein